MMPTHHSLLWLTGTLVVCTISLFTLGRLRKSCKKDSSNTVSVDSPEGPNLLKLLYSIAEKQARKGKQKRKN
jgi:hypothetical protein